MAGRLTKLLGIILYSVLLCCTIGNIASGPLKNYWQAAVDGNTVRVQEEIEASEAFFPSFSVCRFPGFKSGLSNALLFTRRQRENPNATAEEIYRSLDDNTFVAGDFVKSTVVRDSIGSQTKMELGPENWKTVSVDPEFVGNCFSLDSVDFRKKVPVNQPAMMMITLEEQEDEGAEAFYTVQVHENGDSFLIGVVNLDQAKVPRMRVDALDYVIFNMEIEVWPKTVPKEK